MKTHLLMLLAICGVPGLAIAVAPARAQPVQQPVDGSNAGTPLVRPHPLRYVESSNGLDTPQWDGGRSELEFADLNGDGHLDIVSIGDHGSPYINTNMHGLSVWFGDGAGHWTSFQKGVFGYGGLAIGDANNDNLLDAAYGMHHNYSGVDLGDQVLEVALGDGTGRNWTAWDDGLGRDGQSWGMFGTVFLDANADGWLDVASVSFGCCDGIHVYLNNTDGSWMHSFGRLGGNSSMEIEAGDVNNDGFPDLATSHEAGTIWLNNGDGTFIPGDYNLPRGGGFGYPRGVSFGDLNDDGHDDVSFVNGDQNAEVWTWDDDATQWVERTGNLPATGLAQTTRLRDMNMDGHPELVVYGERYFAVFVENDPGEWSLETTVTVPSNGDYAALRIADADHNGYPDFALLSEQGSFFNYRNHLRFFREDSEAVAPGIRIVAPVKQRVVRHGSSFFVDWTASVPIAAIGSARVRLELSLEGQDGPWSVLADDLPNNGRYQTVLDVGEASTNCYLRARLTTDAGNRTALHGPFEIILP